MNESGSPGGNVQVVLHERRTNRKYDLVSDAQGNLSLNLPAGVYDLGLNSSDPSTATCFYGPVRIPEDAARTFALHGTGGRPPGAVFGRILEAPGRQAKSRALVLNPTQVSSSGDPLVSELLPPPVGVILASDGTFDTNLASSDPVLMDVVLVNGDSTLDESVDVATLSRPCYIELATDVSDVTNRLLSNQSDGPDTGPTGAGSGLRPRLQSRFTAANLLNNRTVFFGGLLTGDPSPATQYSFPEIASGPIDNRLSGNLISVGLNGSWWNKFVVNLYSSLTGVGGVYTFVDSSNKSHVLKFSKTESVHIPPIGFDGAFSSFTVDVSAQWRQLSYTSNSPNIGLIYAQPIP